VGSAQIIKQGLARLVGVIKVLLAQHKIEHRVFQPVASVPHAAALHHLAHPVVAQLTCQDAA